MDLFTLPTHLHVIDRLVDLYNQQKRVTVIKNIEAPLSENISPPIMNNKILNSNLNDEGSSELIKRLKSELQESEERSKVLDDKCSSYLKQIEEYKVKLEKPNDEVKKLKSELQESEERSKVSNDKCNSYLQQLEEYKAKIDLINQKKESENSAQTDKTLIDKLKLNISSLEEAIDLHESKRAGYVSTIYKFSNIIRDKCDENIGVANLLFENLVEFMIYLFVCLLI